MKIINSEAVDRVVWFADPRWVVRSLSEKTASDRDWLSQTAWCQSRDSVLATIRDGMTVALSQVSDTAPGSVEDSRPVILAPVSLSSASFQGAQVAINIAQHTGARMIVCHAILPRATRFDADTSLWEVEALCHAALQKMHPIVSLAKEAGVAVSCIAEAGTPVRLTLKLARANDANLIVLASRERNAWSEIFFGKSIADQIISEAECHVMVVRQGIGQVSKPPISIP